VSNREVTKPYGSGNEPFNPLMPTSVQISTTNNGVAKNPKYGGYIDKAIKAQLNQKI